MSLGSRRIIPRKIIMNVTVNDDVQLKKSENAWKPGLKREGPAEDPENQKTQVGLRRICEGRFHPQLRPMSEFMAVLQLFLLKKWEKAANMTNRKYLEHVNL